MSTTNQLNLRLAVFCLLLLCIGYAGSSTAQEISVQEIQLDRDSGIDQVEAGRQFWVEVGQRFFEGTGDLSIPSELLDGRDDADIRWSIAPHPMLLGQLLSVEWEAISDMPVLNFMHEFPEYSSTRQIKAVDLWRAFSIDVIVPHSFGFVHPNQANLIVQLASEIRAIQVNVPMSLDESRTTYVVGDPDEFTFVLSREIKNLQAGASEFQSVRPEMRLREFRGFEFSENTIKNYRFTGVPVSYNVKFGSVVVHDGFQWAGKPDALPLRYPQLPLLTN